MGMLDKGIIYMIYLIGDSHVQSAVGANFNRIHLPAPTAYQNHKRIPEIHNNLNKFNINKHKDYLFFSFGEIDARCHLGFIADKNNKTYDEVVQECIERYEIFLQHFTSQHYKVGVWGAIPSGLHNGIQGNGAASYKTKEERNKITKIFNLKLKKICLEKDILFKTVFDIISNDHENYSYYYSNDNIHLNAGIFKTHNNNIDCEKLVLQQFEDLI
jgi:hypothetical protein